MTADALYQSTQVSWSEPVGNGLSGVNPVTTSQTIAVMRIELVAIEPMKMLASELSIINPSHDPDTSLNCPEE